MDIEEALATIKKALSTERYDHTVRVLDVAKRLVSHYDICKKDVELAVVFHDYAKEMNEDELKQYIIEYKIDENLLSYNRELWHGPVAAHIVQHQFGITNKSILNAIYYHTTGRANMDNVELTLFVADYIEPNRNFSGLEEVREIAYINLHEAALLTLKNTIPYLIKKGATIFPDTFHAYNDLVLHVTGGNK